MELLDTLLDARLDPRLAVPRRPAGGRRLEKAGSLVHDPALGPAAYLRRLCRDPGPGGCLRCARGVGLQARPRRRRGGLRAITHADPLVREGGIAAFAAVAGAAEVERALGPCSRTPTLASRATRAPPCTAPRPRSGRPEQSRGTRGRGRARPGGWNALDRGEDSVPQERAGLRPPLGRGPRAAGTQSRSCQLLAGPEGVCRRRDRRRPLRHRARHDRDPARRTHGRHARRRRGLWRDGRTDEAPRSADAVAVGETDLLRIGSKSSTSCSTSRSRSRKA